MKSRRPLAERGTAALDREIRNHIEERADLLMEQGWSREEALREAERRFGDVSRIREELAAVERGQALAVVEWLRSWASDLRHAGRSLGKRPLFTGSVVLTLALGIGAASAVFAVVDAALLRALPYRGAERLVQVKPWDNQSTGTLPPPAIPEFLAGARELHDGWLAYRRETLVRTDGAGAEQLSVVAVTPGADTLLGIPLLIGRSFTLEDARPDAPGVVVLTREYFERLGGDRSLLGSTLRLESGPATVVGVLRGGVRFPEYADPPDLWMPLRSDFTVANQPGAYAGELWMRLRPGLELAAAGARADALSGPLHEQGLLPPERGIHLFPVGELRAVPDTARALRALAGTVAAIFLIALVNGVNLLLVRAGARGGELRVRLALGASRARLVRQLLVEGSLLGALGGALAALFAWLAIASVQGILPDTLLYFSPHVFEVEERTLAFTVAVSVLAGVVLGLIPGVRVLGGRLGTSSLAGRPLDVDTRGRRLRNGLVVIQVALSMTLLVAAALFVNSFVRLMRVDAGFDHRRVALARVQLSAARYPEPTARAALLRRLEEALAARPEVEAVSVASGVSFTVAPLQAEGAEPAPGRGLRVPFASVAPDYLPVMGIELVAGRNFDAADPGTDAALVDLDLATHLWGRESAVGRRFRLGEEGEWKTVVGVVRELKLMGRDERRGPYQMLYPADPESAGRVADVALRGRGSPAALLPIFREELRRLDPEQWIWRLSTGSQALAEEEGQPRFLLVLMGVLACVAVTLAALGLYGVLAYSVTRRERELGIRTALGANRGRLRTMVLGEGLGMAAAGVLLGGGGAVVASRALEHLLYEVEPGDPWTLLAAAALFFVVAGAASLLPALRATWVDPVEVLKAE